MFSLHYSMPKQEVLFASEDLVFDIAEDLADDFEADRVLSNDEIRIA